MNMKPIKIKLEDQSLLAYRDERVEGQLSHGGFDKLLRRLILEEVDTTKLVGCVVFYVGMLAAYSWETPENTEYGKEEKLEMALANLLPHLPLGVKHLKEVFSHGSTCLICSFDKDGDNYTDDVTYKIKLENGFFKTAQRIVFPNGMAKKDIEREILQILLNALEENPGTHMPFEDLQASVPLSTKALIFNLNLLKEDEKIDLLISPHSDPQEIVSVKIKSQGIKALEGETGTALQSPTIVKNIFGPNIENLTTHGDNSPISISISDVSTALGDIIKEAEKKEFEGKTDVLQALEELRGELAGAADPNKVKTLMSSIKSKAAWIYNLIFKNPVLTAFLTQLLLRSL